MRPKDKKIGRQYLIDTGWLIIDTQVKGRAPSGMAGVADLILHKNDVTVYFEEKVKGDYVTPKQIKFEKEIRYHEGPHLFYILATELEDYTAVAQYYPGILIPQYPPKITDSYICPECGQVITYFCEVRHLKSNHKLGVI